MPWRDAGVGNGICCHIPLDELAARVEATLQTGSASA
jgi:hypothetical protein